MTTFEVTNQIQGLTTEEIEERLKKGQSNEVQSQTSRAYRRIIFENVFTFINIVLFILGIALVLIGRPFDALISVGVLIFNSLIGAIQEIRAKQTLENIQLLYQPKAIVVRDGEEKEISPTEIVLDDILKVGPGDQVLVDGPVVGSGVMNVDESQLTGESDLIRKEAGDQLYSGSFCVTGSGYYRAEKIGDDSFANQLAAQARESRRVLTPLQKQIDVVIRVILLIVIFLEFLIIANDLVRAATLPEEVEHATIIASVVPTTLLLTIAIAYGVGAVRVARFGALAQQANAMEAMSNIDLLCMDKTGTLTTNQFRIHALHPIGIKEEEFSRILGVLAASEQVQNKTTKALAATYPFEARQFVTEVPFSSALKWSAVSFDDADFHGIYALGAVEMVRPYLGNAGDEDSPTWQAIEEQVDEWSGQGLRVLIAAHHPDPQLLVDQGDDSRLPNDMVLLGLISLEDELREDVQEILNNFTENGVQLKVISGDSPETVAALAKQVGFDEDIKLVSGLELEQMDDAQLAEAAESGTIFGRITPQQKERLVDALRDKGHYVAMMGDGVNDVLSLKKASLGIAMQSGSQATRSVADIVLIQDSFSSLAPAVAEGQRIVNGMQDVLRLYLSRISITIVLILAAMVIGVFPVSLRQRPLFTTFTVAIPAILLALWARPGAQPKGSSLGRELLHFIVPPTITSAAIGLVLFYGLLDLRFDQAGITVTGDILTAGAEVILMAQTSLVTFLTITGLLLIIFAEPPTEWWVGADEFSGDWRPTILAGVMFIVYLLAITVPIVRPYFEVVLIPWQEWVLVIVASLIWLFTTRYMWRRRTIERFLGIDVGD
jgi:cation-transporting ATPase E